MEKESYFSLIIFKFNFFFFEKQQQKLQEHILQELNEQLQLNVIQQSQLMQGTSDKNKNNKQQLQQLAVQQQQLVQQIQQIQLQQRQFLLACLVQPFGVPQGRLLCQILRSSSSLMNTGRQAKKCTYK